MLLNYIGFSGSLPHSIGNLKMLSTIIDLSNCNLSRPILNSLASLTQLVYFDVSFNMFSGSFPIFSMAKNLINLYLSYNNLTGQITSTQWKELLKLIEISLLGWKFTKWEYFSFSVFPSIIASVSTPVQPIFWSTQRIFQCFFLHTKMYLFG